MLRVTGDYLFQWMSDRFLSNRTINPLVGTLCSMSVVLVFHPMALLSIGFQLSYVLALALRYSSQFQVKAGSFRTSWLCFWQVYRLCSITISAFHGYPLS